MRTTYSMRVFFSVAISLAFLTGPAHLDDILGIISPLILDFLAERLTSFQIDLLNPDPRIEESFRLIYQSIQEKLLKGYFLNVKYLLYTPQNPNKQHILQSTQNSLNESGFDSNLETKILIHGYSVELSNTSVFLDIKDQILLEGNYNVILVNWTDYNGPSYIPAVAYSYAVGLDLANLISFLMNNTNVSAKSFHLIGHSLGAHLAATAGKSIPDLGRISSLDAAGTLFQILPTYLKLTDTDAIFVDSVHTNGQISTLKGFGTLNPNGDSDFFPNGGRMQPNCEEGDVFLDTDETKETVNPLNQVSCNHDRAPYLFLASINNTRCKFLSVPCESYEEFKNGNCKASLDTVAEMGFHAKPMPSLQKQNTFFLNTSGQYPYCIPMEQ